jgi:hypothetical protein
MILAPNDPALAEATAFFLSNFVTAENAAFDKEEKTISLPAVCEYYRRSEALLMVENGVNRTVLVYPANAGSATKNAVKSFANRFKQLTNTELPVYADTDHAPDPALIEILIGETDRGLPQRSYPETLQSGQWKISAAPELNAICVLAEGDMALLCALDRLLWKLYDQVFAISKLPLEENTEGRTLYVKSDFSLGGLEPPAFPTAASYTFYNGSYRFVSSTQVSEWVWDSYNKKIRYASFTRDLQTEENGVVTTVYRGDARTVTLIYNKNNKSMTLRVTFE